MGPQVITFDCYGTLVQWPETLRAFFETLLPDAADAERFHEDFGRVHTRLKHQAYRPYSVVLSAALAETMAMCNLPGTARAQARLLEAVRNVPPYDDAITPLRSLAEKHRLAIISNTEDGLIAATVAGLQVPFTVISAEQARAYKPDHRLFTFAHERLGVSVADVVHVGAGYATDMVPAFELGLPRIWINRRNEQPDASMPPSAELPDLAGLETTVDALTR